MNEMFNNLGFIIGGLRHLTGKQAWECCQSGALIVDVREDFETALKGFGVKNVLWCPFDSFDAIFRTLPGDRPLIIADCVGLHSKEAALKLLENGYQEVANLAGGIADWERDGLPMDTDVECMSGQCPCTMRSKKK